MFPKLPITRPKVQCKKLFFEVVNEANIIEYVLKENTVSILLPQNFMLIKSSKLPVKFTRVKLIFFL